MALTIVTLIDFNKGYIELKSQMVVRYIGLFNFICIAASYCAVFIHYFILLLYDFELEIACPLFWDVLAEE